MLSGIALWGTLHGSGPFIRATPHESLLLLQAFMGVVAVTTTVLAAVVAERKTAEQGLQRAHDELAVQVQQRTEALAAAEAANQELEAFSYSVSHDLRAPLRAINGFVRILLEDHLPELSPEAQGHLLVVSDSARHMGRLVDDLLAFSRVGRQSVNQQVIATGDLVRQCLQDVRPLWEGRQVEIVIGDLPKCEADLALLKQVFLNLLDNAIKFTRRREVARIEVGWQDRAGQHTYFVRDNGVGFDMRYADKLFGVFQRLHLADEYEGTGVGLALVQRIIHRHGGRVWAEAEVDKGATFYFTLSPSCSGAPLG